MKIHIKLQLTDEYFGY